MKEIGKLEPINLRSIWAHEALDFTKWLAQPENLELLSNELGIEILNPSTEIVSGNIRVDILAQDREERNIIIENQLYNTDHDHLGKIIEYASAFKASYIIWISPKITEEHRSALDWLNEHTVQDIHFFGIEIKAYKIGESLPAPKFEVICKPNEWTKYTRATAQKEISKFGIQYFEFWSEFNNFLEKKNSNVQIGKPSHEYYYSIKGNPKNINMYFNIIKKNKEARFEIYINDNKLYDFIKNNYSHLFESFFDGKLNIKNRSRDDIMASSIAFDIDEKSNWEKTFKWFEKCYLAYKTVLEVPIIEFNNKSP